jgi:hypothetical protein
MCGFFSFWGLHRGGLGFFLTFTLFNTQTQRWCLGGVYIPGILQHVAGRWRGAYVAFFSFLFCWNVYDGLEGYVGLCGDDDHDDDDDDDRIAIHVYDKFQHAA